ncbi:uncharacterized protein LOC103989622 isoform X2 [Musa acuminata AAA Group]
MEVVPVFITVDPERDNVEQVCECVKEFHPDLIGLTGTADETRPVAHAFRVYYMKTEQEGVMLHFCRRQAKVRIQRMRFTANVGSQGDQPPLYIEELFPRREDTGMDRVTGLQVLDEPKHGARQIFWQEL